MKTKGRRLSSNVVDQRGPGYETKNNLEAHHLRQIFKPNASKKITAGANTISRRDPLSRNGPGVQKLRSPAAKKVQYNIFSKQPKTPSKKGSK